jgi:phosphatidate cytidylyltransferase|tara:strand:+ start:668 stop:1330 length:663 start_codon:yes stop_codon:yes gene_type:complete
MAGELKKRILTSLFLLSLLFLMFSYIFILIIFLIIICIISWIEFYSLICKIFKKENIKNKVLRFILKATSLIYLSILIYLILMTKLSYPELEIFIIYPILVSIMSDIGGLVIGRTFKGRKLTKISPKKTISGSIGSFIFSLSLIPFYIKSIPEISLLLMIFITIVISLSSQIGDLFISYLKRKAKVKNTSNLLPGHGGVLDRIDGIIFSIPIGFSILFFI